MKSMTGFGQASRSAEGISLQVEISSVNRKNLDLHISLPRHLAPFEACCQKIISAQCARGRVQAKVLVESKEKTGQIHLNQDRVREWLNELNALAAETGLTPVTSVTDVFRFPRVLEEKDEAESNHDDIWPLLQEALTEAITDLVSMRTTEGTHLQKVLSELCDELEEVLKTICPLLPEAREMQSQKIRDAVIGLGDLSEEMQNRVLQEIALQAEKSDVQEEVDRLEGHLQQMRQKIVQAEPVGRALDFLCQELARELNTLSVKASRSDINRLALSGKEVVEKIREQVQNVE
ncbi:YicC family protein [Kiritimatiellota bacterium B12222]|nr:YicC family protein [Kiritimatiellota bacterium B12222]